MSGGIIIGIVVNGRSVGSRVAVPFKASSGRVVRHGEIVPLGFHVPRPGPGSGVATAG